MKIRGKLECVAPLLATDVVHFGKYKGKTYAEAKMDAAYAEWVLEMDREQDFASPGLRRLAEWLRLDSQKGKSGVSTKAAPETPPARTGEASSSTSHQPMKATPPTMTTVSSLQETTTMEDKMGPEVREELRLLQARIDAVRKEHHLDEEPGNKHKRG